MTRAELLHEAGLYKAAFNYGRRKVRGAGGGAWHYVTTTKKDAKDMFKYHKVLNRSGGKTLLLNQLTGSGGVKGVGLRGVAHAMSNKTAMKRLDKVATRQNLIMQRAMNRRNVAIGRNAVRVGAVALGAGALAWGAKTYRDRKREAQSVPQFSSYDVYPQLGHSAARQQSTNRPVYYDDYDVGTGPPRVENREELINNILEALLES